MSDRRLTLANGRYADVALRGQVHADHFVVPERFTLNANAWLLDDPQQKRDRQGLFGDLFSVVERRDCMAFGQLEKDGYVGWVPVGALETAGSVTHRVSVRTTWAWPEPNFKTPPLVDLHMSSRVEVIRTEGEWAVLRGESHFVPIKHLSDISHDMKVVDAARIFLGTPYVWAGNTGFGIDCSGLVQVAYHAAGLACPPDSDLQERGGGAEISSDEPLIAGDLVFWRGHVAMATGPETLIHANAHHMSVVEEPVDIAVQRISTTDTGSVTSRLRPDFGPLEKKAR